MDYIRFVFNGIICNLCRFVEWSTKGQKVTLEEADDLSLIFKGITFEVADKKLMDILFFGQS